MEHDERNLEQVKDLTGMRFGSLTVTGDSGKRNSGSILWLCRCDCGRNILAMRYQLLGGSVTSCGCKKKPSAARGHVEDLTGQRFGRLTVTGPAEKNRSGHVCWHCRCDCGNETVVVASRLKSGKTKSCGCLKHRASLKALDLTGRRFGRLTVLSRAGKDRHQNVYWHCRCDCGKELDVASGSLLRGVTRSCGCLNREHGVEMHACLHFENGTCTEYLKRICADTAKRKSKAGFRGLFLLESGKYRSTITFQGKHYNLGHYTNFADAVQARLDAEEVLHKGYLKAKERYAAKADADPAWAEENPFCYSAVRVNGSFQITTNAPEEAAP